MDFSAVLAIGVVAGCVLALILTHVTPGLVLFGGLIVLVVSGVLSAKEALVGFANEGLITVALMYVVAAGIRETGGLELIVRTLLGRPRALGGALGRMMPPVAVMSAFLNNTPVVATFIPAVMSWAKRIEISPSKLLLPLSYAAILGGTCTLIGTSTNLIVNGMLRSELEHPGLGLFEITWVGLPATLIGLWYVTRFAGRLIPERVPATSTFDRPKEYTVEMTVAENGPLVGKTVEQAGLRHLQGLFLVEIEREGRFIPAVGSLERLRAGDRLVFAGVTESVVELQRIKGLRPSAEPSFSLKDQRAPERLLVEVVVSPTCQLLGRTIGEGRFRNLYGATVIAAARNGRRILGKLANIRLQPSDTLLLETRRSFLERHRNSRDFLLISEVENSTPPRFERAWVSWTILGALVAAVTTGLLSMLQAAMLAAAAMMLAGCCSPTVARRSIDTNVLLAIASAFALGKGLEVTGAAASISDAFLGLAGARPWAALAFTYVMATILTETVTNNAVAVLMFPIVLLAAGALEVSYMPFMITVMMGASASFATPLGYQTNLMIFGPGGYRFADYVRFGLPLNLLVGLVTVLLAPIIWPFHP